jgi:hypothetical protein
VQSLRVFWLHVFINCSCDFIINISHSDLQHPVVGIVFIGINPKYIPSTKSTTKNENKPLSCQFYLNFKAKSYFSIEKRDEIIKKPEKCYKFYSISSEKMIEFRFLYNSNKIILFFDQTFLK